MSYDISLCDPITDEVILFDFDHEMKGGTYAVRGTNTAWLNITYNYSPHYYRVMGKKGIREIYGKTGAESIPILKKAIEQLGDDTDPNYWKPTEGNAKKPLFQLLAMAKIRPDGIWEGD
jgi:hypothetical protein